jgi:predicted GNAT family N-acyltransferase
MVLDMIDAMLVVCSETLPEESRSIREEVFVEEQGFSEEFDTVDHYALHFVAYAEDNTPIGTCRIFKENEADVYFLGRLAVLKSARKMGVGRLLLAKAEEKASELGAGEIRLHSQCRAREFYEKCGYSAYGEIELDEGCPHIWMRKAI